MAGDCDCFTIFTVSMLMANGYDPKNINIYLQGNNKTASHILIMVENKENNIYIDFTQDHFNTIRKYNYYQIINIEKYL